MTETEALKQQLADCIRMLEKSDIIDYNGHASIRADPRSVPVFPASSHREPT